MKQRALSLIGLTLLAWASGLGAEEPAAGERGSAVTVYTKSGEVLSGTVVERDAVRIVVERPGGRLSVVLQDVERLEAGPPTKTVLRPDFSTAVVTYAYSGAQSGQEVIYIDRVGKRAASKKTVTMTILGTSKIKSEWLIHDSRTVSYIDVEKRLVVTTPHAGDPMSEVLGDWSGSEASFGEEVILGRTCRLVRVASKTACVWQGIPLHLAVAHPMGESYNFEQQAISLNVNGALPDEPLVVPSDFAVKTMEQMMGELGTAMQSLVKQMGPTGMGTAAGAEATTSPAVEPPAGYDAN